MRVAVFGAGAVGAFFGGLLQRGGADVHFIARGDNLAALRRDGILIRSLRLGEIRVAPVHAESDARRIGTCDLVLICVKAYQTPAILDDLALLVGDDTTIVTLQNGVESDEPVAARFGRDRVIPGVVYVGATLDEPGIVSHVAAGTIAIGSRAGRASRSEPPGTGTAGTNVGRTSRSKPADPGVARSGPADDQVQRAADALALSGQPVKVVDDIQSERWVKLLWNASFNPVSAITGRTPRELVDVPATRALLIDLMREVIAVAQAHGLTLDESMIAEQLAWTERASAIRTSMMVDRERGRGMEIDALVGVVVRTGTRHGVPTPFSQSMLALLEAITAVPPDRRSPEWIPPPRTSATDT
jgi:2-dehydropantoate 2-reductase